MYDYKEIANYFIQKAKDENIPLSPLKLQKLMYFAYGIYIALKGKPLFSERFSAWKYGPVITQLYHLLKGYGNQTIDRKLRDVNPDSLEMFTPEISSEDKDLKKFLDNFWGLYKNYSAVQLSNATHLKDTPWDKAFKNGDNVVDDGEIKNYFKGMVERTKIHG